MIDFMGSSATISMFDQSYWDETFIPAAYDLFSCNVIRPWVKEVFEKDAVSVSELRIIDSFEKCCSIMVDFAAIDAGIYSRKLDEEKPRIFSNADWGRRRCRDKKCQSNDHCPFYFKDKGPIQQDYGCYFWRMIDSFLDQEHKYIFLGGRFRTASYKQILDEHLIFENWKVRELLDRLGSRGFYIGDGAALDDGVHGWLSQNECKELAEELWALNLPVFESTVENLKNMRPNNGMIKGINDYEEQQKAWTKHSLAYLRAFAEYAGNSRNGIVWINL